MARSRQWQTQVVEVDNPTSTTTSLNFSTSILWTFLEQFEALVNRLVFWWPRTACSISTCLTKAFSITSSLQSGLRYIRPSSWETGLQNASWPVHTMSSCLLLMTSVLPCNAAHATSVHHHQGQDFRTRRDQVTPWIPAYSDESSFP
jgi:hypothetical protein